MESFLGAGGLKMGNTGLNNVDGQTRIEIDNDAKRFFILYKDPVTRPSLLVRLQELGLLSEFLEAEN